MKNDDLVSIIVPIYNIEDYISKCIRSIVSQTYENIEIILVNDGSTDRSRDICNRFKAIDKRIRLVNKENGGLLSARKAGLDIANGMFMTFVDGDDWIKKNHIENLFYLAKKYSSDMVVSGHERYFLGKRKRIRNNLHEGVYNRSRIESEVIPRAIFSGNFFEYGISTYVWNKLFLRNEAKKLLDTIDDKIIMAEDSCLTYPYLMQSNKLVVSNLCTYVYRQRSNSIIKTVNDIENEYSKLSLAFQHLKQSFSTFDREFNLDYQLENYFYYLLLVRSGGYFRDIKTKEFIYFAFEDVRLGSNVLIFSTGAFGQQINNAINNSNMKCIGWLDNDFLESQKEGLGIIKYDDLNDISFDHIIIASINPTFIQSTKNKLSGLGIEEKKISIVTRDLDRMKSIASTIGFDENYVYSRNSS